MNSCVVVSFLFDANLSYVSDFINSLESQTCKEFDVLIFNDGVSSENISKIKSFSDINLIFVDVFGTPAEIREKGLLYLKNTKYEYIVFGDTDDYFSNNRIESSIISLKKNSILVSNLSTVTQSGALIRAELLSQRLTNGSQYDCNFLIHKNILGFGNSAIHRRMLNYFRFSIPKDIIAVDWFVFFLLLYISKEKVYFDAKSTVFYRQYETNTSFGEATMESFLRSVRVKKVHYDALISSNLLSTDDKAVYLQIKTAMMDEKNTKFEPKAGATNVLLWWEEALVKID